MHTPGVEDTCSCGLTPFVAPAVSSVCLFLNLVFLSVWLGAGAAPVSSPGVTRDLWSLSEPRRPWTAGPGSGLAPDSSRGLGKQVPVIVLPSWHVEHDNKIIYFFSPGSSHIWCLPYTGMHLHLPMSTQHHLGGQVPCCILCDHHTTTKSSHLYFKK